MSTATEERYARAIRTSHLEVEDAPGDVDSIIAAGMAESLGVLLTRLRTEWETISRTEAKQAANSQTARLLILMNLRSLEPAKRAIFALALARCDDPAAKPRAELKAMTTKLSEQLSPDDRAALIAAHARKCREVADASAAHRKRVADLVGKALDVWLDRLCHRCEGRGFSGGYGVPKVMCTTCGGSGSRRQGQLSKSRAMHHFGQWLLNALDSKCSSSVGQMTRKTRQG